MGGHATENDEFQIVKLNLVWYNFFFMGGDAHENDEFQTIKMNLVWYKKF